MLPSQQQMQLRDVPQLAAEKRPWEPPRSTAGASAVQLAAQLAHRPDTADTSVPPPSTAGRDCRLLPAACRRYCEVTGHDVVACRFRVMRDDDVHGWLGASPDGLVPGLLTNSGRVLGY